MEPKCDYCNAYDKNRCKTVKESEECLETPYVINTKGVTGEITVKRTTRNQKTSITIHRSIEPDKGVLVDLDEADRMIKLLKDIIDNG